MLLVDEGSFDNVHFEVANWRRAVLENIFLFHRIIKVSFIYIYFLFIFHIYLMRLMTTAVSNVKFTPQMKGFRKDPRGTGKVHATNSQWNHRSRLFPLEPTRNIPQHRRKRSYSRLLGTSVVF